MEKQGDPIPNSRFFRDFCADCGEPIRVSVPGPANFCGECQPRKPVEQLPGMHMVGEKLHLGKARN